MKKINYSIKNNLDEVIGTITGFVFDTKDAMLKRYFSSFTDKNISLALSQVCHKVAVIDYISVDEVARGLGHGSELIDYFKDLSIEENADSVVLVCSLDEVQVNGFNLYNFYQSKGFYNIINDNNPIMMTKRELAFDVKETINSLEYVKNYRKIA